MSHQIHMDITTIRGYQPNPERDGCFARASIGVYFDINGYKGAASVWGDGMSSRGLLQAIWSAVRMQAEHEEEVADKIRDSWEHLRILFTGYYTGRHEGFDEGWESHIRGSPMPIGGRE